VRTQWTARGRTRGTRAAVAGLAAGAIAGAATILAGAAVAVRSAEVGSAVVEATHLPPLLTAAGQPVELEYEVHCLAAADADVDRPCAARGTMFVRTGHQGAFRAVALTRGGDGRLRATVPDEIARSRSGFSYYAVIEDETTGATATLPAAGPGAPQRSYPLGRPVTVSLREHRFGIARAASDRVAEAAWGSGSFDVELEEGRNLTPIGGSSFDVAGEGTVLVLDEANRRVLRWSPGASRPTPVPLAINGTLADLAVADDGALWVLETTPGPESSPVLRAFTGQGDPLGSIRVAERASQVRLGPGGAPFTLQHPSGQWMRVSDDARRLLPAADQRDSGRAGRPLPGGGEVIVLRDGSDVRVALVTGGSVRQAWLVTSETPLAEVQLAEMLGTKLVLVLRAYTDARDEFVVLVLDGHGLVDRFSVDSADWAETAPLSRFRVVGGSLYQLGSTPAGLFVDRYDLEVAG
jgi:hypothetical protein